MRDYNFRIKAKQKERGNLKIIASGRYFPTKPKRSYDENGKEYFVQGRQDHLKKHIKKQASKSTRRYKKGLSNGGSYKKVYDVPWEWY